MNNNTANYCVILAGGFGTRLWPSSRQSKPKQFIDFFGTGETLLQTTYRRFARFIDKENIIVMSNHQYVSQVREQLPELPDGNLLLEPMRRNTVPSVTWASVEISHRNPQACMIVTPADQMITDTEVFIDDITLGLDYVAHNDRLLTLGVVPTRPETSYGYIQISDPRGGDIFEVKSFTEKPELEFAKLFVENKEFLWNTGLFVWKATTFLQAVHQNTAYFLEMLEDAERKFEHGEDVVSMVADTFAKCPNVSLEQGVLEKVDNVDVMLCHFGWSDIGTWNALFNAMHQTASDKNVVMARHAMLYDCKDCLVKLPSGRIAFMQGLEDYIVVEEGDILVICKKDDPSAIRMFVNDVQLTMGDEYV